jgi:hypothetical protein
MQIINNSKDITTLEVGDKVMFGDLEYIVCKKGGYFLRTLDYSSNDKIFTILGLSKIDFIKNLGINILSGDWIFPKVKSLEVLTIIVSALLKEYEKQNELPKTWEEFCEKNRAKDEYYISNGSCIICVEGSRNPNTDKNLCISKQEAEAHLAFMQLRQLRKAYVKNWEPDWMSDTEPKYCVNLQANSFDVQCWYHMSNPFSFPTARLAKQFLDNFRDLLEVAEPLL